MGKPALTDMHAISAARNNADLYEALFSAHELGFLRVGYGFVAEDPPLPYYAHLTVASPGQHGAVMEKLKELAGKFAGIIAFKDSFCEFDLGQNGFITLFESSWIWREVRQVGMPQNWMMVDHPNDLLAWEREWKRSGSPTDQHMFPEQLLSNENVAFIGKKNQGRYVAGCIANKSSDCVGLSNFFSETPSETIFGQAADAVAVFGNGLPVVGYESGEELEYAMKAGFVEVGRLRIMLAEKAEFPGTD